MNRKNTRTLSVFEEQMRRDKLLSRAIGQTMVCIWATDLDGNITLSEGGLLPHFGLEPGQVVGENVRNFPSYESWQAALRQIQGGAPVVTYLVAPEEPVSYAQLPGGDLELKNVGVCIESYSPLFTAAGRLDGLIVTAMSTTSARPFRPLRACPLGTCVLPGGQEAK
jgi:hypothetical protein